MPMNQRQASSYREQVREALDKTFKDTPQNEIVLDIHRDRYIIFSDLHRGGRNRADDFRLAERAYNAALAYYFQLGYTLVVLGDVEELWEERPKTVVKAYEYSLSWEAKFHQAGRYLRFWGNHDDDWRYEDMVKSYLQPIFGGQPLKVRESINIQVKDGETALGQFFLLHGHQGTTASDKYSALSRLVVRYLWRPYQRFTGRSLNTPSNDWELRDNHNIALYSWAAKQSKVILIAGHTHRPVFESRSHPAQIQEQLLKLGEKLATNPYDEELQKEAGELAAELEWVRAQENGLTGAEGNVAVRMTKPCYFNTGCCCFADGDITGLEIAGGEIRLVRLPNDKDRPLRQILTSSPLREVFGKC